jgi:hypothetical protein
LIEGRVERRFERLLIAEGRVEEIPR